MGERRRWARHILKRDLSSVDVFTRRGGGALAVESRLKSLKDKTTVKCALLLKFKDPKQPNVNTLLR